MRVEWTTRAQADLAEVLRYVIEKFGLNTAMRVNGEILEDVDKLSRFPMLGRALFTEPHSGLVYRSLSLKQSSAIYIIEDETVKVVLLWNNRRDNKKLHAILSENKI
jgi:plasmid stabilization system protein ParE